MRVAWPGQGQERGSGPRQRTARSDQRPREKEEEMQANHVNRAGSAGLCDRFLLGWGRGGGVEEAASVTPDFWPEWRGDALGVGTDVQAQR